METKNGFSFKRRSTAKVGNMSINITDKICQDDAYENEFVFKRISTNSAISNKKLSTKSNKKESTVKKVSSMKNTVDNPFSDTLSENEKKIGVKDKKSKEIIDTSSNVNREKEAVNFKKGKSVLRKKSSKSKNEINLVENSLLQFNVVKKRKTIALDRSIDISSSSIIIGDNSSIENCIKDENLLKEKLSLNANKLKEGKAINKNLENENLELRKTEIQTCNYDQLVQEIKSEKIKSNEIYKKVNSNNINDLIKGCIGFLSYNDSYSYEIVKHCNSNFFSDIDYRREIESTNNKIEQLKTEVKKWNSIFEIQKRENIDIINGKEINTANNDTIAIESSFYDIENHNNSQTHENSLKTNQKESNLLENSNTHELIEIIQDKVTDDKNLLRSKTANKLIIEEFEEKSRKLRSLDQKLRLFLENAKEKSENLLRNVFDSIENRPGDALFLLKAMSRLGR